MKTCKPEYYDRFHCIADACRDSCCIGWEIDVDDEKSAYYKTVSGELGERLRTCIDWKEGHFILQGKEERCPFLNRDNLCDLILGLGEESLCDICREHPRFYDWYDGYTEAGLGLCCEEAARLLLESDKKLTFISDHYIDEEPWVNVLFSARSTAISILQNRTVSIWKRIRAFFMFIEELQDCIEFDNMEEAEETVRYYAESSLFEELDNTQTFRNPGKDFKFNYETVIELCEELEPMDSTWLDLLKDLKDFVQDNEFILHQERKFYNECGSLDYHYEHLAVYFTYRYFMKSREDSSLYSKGMLLVFCLLLIHLLDLYEFTKIGTVTTESRAWNSKRCSKEIEYSEDNLEKLEETLWNADFEAFYCTF